MTGTDYEYGLYKNRIPYLIREGEGPSVIIFEPSRELVKSLIFETDRILKTYDHFLPPNCSLCILGYDRNLPAAHTHEQLIHDYARLITEKFRPGIVMGISYGGALAIPFAALYPDLTQKLILLVSAYGVSPDGLQLIHEFIHLMETNSIYEVMQRFNSLFEHAYLRWIAFLLTRMKKKSLFKEVNPPSTFINAYKQIIKSNGENKKYLSRITVPALVIGGDHDQFFSKDLFEETASLLPMGKALIFKNEGHYVVLEKRKDIRKVLSGFMVSD